MKHSPTHPQSSVRAFTLIELLVVIAIIGLLAAVVLAALSTARNNGADARRVADLKGVQSALQLYSNNHNGNYPSTSDTWYSQCSIGGIAVQSTANAVIPGLVTDGDIGSIPSDPQMNSSSGTCCYMYRSNGSDYKFMVGYNCSTANYYNPAMQSLLDPERVGANGYPQSGNSSDWAAYTAISGSSCTLGSGQTSVGGACY
jgi:prepilin-type N-terminal cleavage/methylation domain-containing protein